MATKRKISVSVGTASKALDRFERTWHAGATRKAQAPELRLTFENLPLLLKSLTPARWTLLEALKRDGPLSVSELARRLGRNYKNVHTDVARLIELGLVERRSDQSVAVVWDVVVAEMRLAA